MIVRRTLNYSSHLCIHINRTEDRTTDKRYEYFGYVTVRNVRTEIITETTGKESNGRSPTRWIDQMT